jgi:hypothetical protein
MNMVQMKETALNDYALERESLTENEIQAILDHGRKWNLAPILARGGSAIFPHTYIKECGHQMAAVVHGCLNSGADRVLLLGVLHPLNDNLQLARKKEIAKMDISQENSFGVFGPGISGESAWEQEFSLDSFLFLWFEEVKRRGIRAPELIIRYPSLVNRQPDKLPGMDELKSIAKDAVVIGTSDLCHHGRAYGMNLDEVMDISPLAQYYAKHQIQKGLDLLKEGNFEAYYEHCIRSLSDSVDVGTVLRYLLGQIEGTILDLKLVDVANLFEHNPRPSWVAASLIVFERQLQNS